MKKTSILCYILVSISLLLLPACSNTKPQMEPGTMRIWLSPANRSNVNVDPDGNIYIKVHSYD